MAANHVENRETVISTLREEIIGPSPLGDEIDCTGKLVFSAGDDWRKPYRQKGSGEEILQREAPLTRYGAGVLYPFDDAGSDGDSGTSSEADLIIEENAEATEVLAAPLQAELEELIENAPPPNEETDLDLSAANRRFPSSMGISFFAQFDDESKLVVRASGGRYVKKEINVDGKLRDWWLRIPVTVEASFVSSDILRARGKVEPSETNAENLGELKLSIEAFSRHREGNSRLMTITLVNRSGADAGSYSRDRLSLFQSYFETTIIDHDDKEQAKFLPYPEIEARRRDAEESSLDLLYRDVKTFAVGHGCSADWISSGGSCAEKVMAEIFPVCETPSITPDIADADGNPLSLSMKALAGLDSEDDGLSALANLISQYEDWISKKREITSTLPERYLESAQRHLDACESAATRMQEGFEFLQNNRDAATAFRLANHAVLLQQVRGGREPRKASINSAERLEFSEPYESVDLNQPASSRGKWRAFQIAFLLMNLRSSAIGHDPHRETVELIWFPTGGGKTEAYLGLTAYSLFMRRLRDKTDNGVHVLMRYTLRLLTSQQFQRACGLICAMEHLRRGESGLLGDEPFSIGLWLGGDSTPNNRATALKKLNELRKGGPDSENVFAVLKCPWCRAEMGPIVSGTGRRKRTHVFGYEQSGPTVVFKCPDSACEFHSRIPLYVIDEDMYEDRPSLVIGVVDKFASLAWNPNIRSLFGIGLDGKRLCSPPGLIIQDELHLISGPLGSMVGLYETLIEELCTDRRDDEVIRPKIVSSTATIRRYEEQVRSLYAREKVALFPPSGIDASDSFFAKYKRNEDGTLAPGRKYVGINAPGLGSLQNTEVRTYTALLQAPLSWSPEEQDPWWTLLIFFSNLRMLGNTLSLFQSNVPTYINAYAGRRNENRRFADRIEELTGRLKNDEVPLALAKLEIERKAEKDNAVDVCLASNIIEVGVDVDRLSLITVVGQPKSTSQYIQVTGRVGRKSDRPGLIVSIFSASKPRDRSHFEKFQTYHQKLYAQVEPTSVTPFSPPAIERALHGVLVGFVRQAGDSDATEKPWPLPNNLIGQFRELITDRAKFVDANETDTVEDVLKRRIRQWETWQHPNWDVGYRGDRSGEALMRSAGTWIPPEDELVTWATPTSMRNVDAESSIQITKKYLLEEVEDE